MTVGWATSHIKRLEQGLEIQFRPRGQSMVGIIESGQKVTVAPASVEQVAVGDVVVCSVYGRQFLHLVSARRRGQAQISNAQGHINGWTTHVYGKVTKVEP